MPTLERYATWKLDEPRRRTIEQIADCGLRIADFLLEALGTALPAEWTQEAGKRSVSLAGITVVVTRSREQNVALRELLESRRADVVDLPTLRFVAISPADSVRERLLAYESYTHLVFTSQTAVEFFAKACREAEISPDTWRRIDIAAVGPATAVALEEHGWPASVITDGSGETLAYRRGGKLLRQTHQRRAVCNAYWTSVYQNRACRH